MSRAARRAAVGSLVGRGLSERRACALVGLARATRRYRPRPRDDAELAAALGALAARHPRYGYRRAWALLRRAGRPVNRKRVLRLWRRARLQVRRAPRRRGPPPGERPEPAPPTRATHPGHVWSYDFVLDACLGGAKLRLLTVVDEFTRECLAIRVGVSLPAARVLAALAALFAAHGPPAHLRSDNGPEFIALLVRAWLAQRQTTTLYIAPGCPWQNGIEERFNGTLRDECLNRHAFLSVAEAQAVVEAYRREYNEVRPHSRLGYKTPAEFKRDWLTSQPLPARP